MFRKIENWQKLPLFSAIGFVFGVILGLDEAPAGLEDVAAKFVMSGSLLILSVIGLLALETVSTLLKVMLLFPLLMNFMIDWLIFVAPAVGVFVALLETAAAGPDGVERGDCCTTEFLFCFDLLFVLFADWGEASFTT